MDALGQPISVEIVPIAAFLLQSFRAYDCLLSRLVVRFFFFNYLTKTSQFILLSERDAGSAFQVN